MISKIALKILNVIPKCHCLSIICLIKADNSIDQRIQPLTKLNRSSFVWKQSRETILKWWDGFQSRNIRVALLWLFVLGHRCIVWRELWRSWLDQQNAEKVRGPTKQRGIDWQYAFKILENSLYWDKPYLDYFRLLCRRLYPNYSYMYSKLTPLWKIRANKY